MGRWLGSWAPHCVRRGRRRDSRGAFSADWMLVIAAVLGLGGLSAYLVEENIESLTLERSANQRDTVAYLDGGRTLNAEHRDVRRALAAAEQIVSEATSVSPDDARFPTWWDWTRHFDAKCRRLALGYSHMDDFTVTSLFLPPLKPFSEWGTAAYEADPGNAGGRLTATELADTDTTPYPEQASDKATVADLVALSARKKIAASPNRWKPPSLDRFSTIQSLNEGIHRGPVAWCYLPRSVSATLPDGTWDDDNLRYKAAVAWARGVVRDAVSDDPDRPGNKALPGTWRNWEDHWTAKCMRALEIFSDLKGFTVEADFTKPAAADSDALIRDPLRAPRYPYRLDAVKTKTNPGNRASGVANCTIVAA